MILTQKIYHSFLLLIFIKVHFVSAQYAQIRIHQGFTQIHDVSSEIETVSSYAVNEKYTFEVYLTETMQRDYVIEECTMNNNVFIGQNGCVQCGNCVEQSIETEAYNKPGAIKRTLVHFIARSPQIVFKCKIREIDCSGCAERSCQRQHQIFLNQYIYHTTTLMHPAAGYSVGHFPPPQFPPPAPHIYPTPYFGGSPPYQIPPPAAPPMIPGGGAAIAHGGSSGLFGTWPWWIWLLLLLLLLLLLCCLIALCFALWLRKRKQRKTTTTTTVAVTDSGKDCGVGTEKVAVHCVSTDTNDIVKVQPAIVVGGSEGHSEHHSSAARYQANKHQHQQREEVSDEYGASGGSYSLREGRVHENYTRTIPYDSHRFNDRQSYRNFAYERDMGRVEPLDGYDEVETRERTYCLSDDEQEIVERDVKRTHTTRFVQETREFDTEEESYRGDEHHHASYTHSLPV